MGNRMFDEYDWLVGLGVLLLALGVYLALGLAAMLGMLGMLLIVAGVAGALSARRDKALEELRGKRKN